MVSEWLLIGLTIILSGFFSGSEIGFVSASRLRLELRSRKADLPGRYLGGFLQNPEKFLITTLVGNNIVNVLYATLMAVFLADPVKTIFQNITGNDSGEAIVLIIQTTIASLIIMFFGEILPKAIFRTHADAISAFIAFPMQIANWLFRPLIVISNISSRLLLRLLRVEEGSDQHLFGRQDIEQIIKEIHDTESGTDIDRDDTELLSNVLELSTKRVKDSMVPRTEIVAVEKNTDLEDIHKIFVSSGYSKLPVYDETIDNIIGVIFAYDLFKRPENLDEIIRPVKMIPFTKRSKDLMADFRLSHISVAIVLDEYGGTSGLVTIEDLIEEVVGDIEDEYDVSEEIMKKLNENTFVLSGSVELEDLSESYPEIGIPFDDSNFETIAGFIIHYIGRIPRVNEELVIQHYKFIISKASPSRIETVKLILLDAGN
jgi:CBS domain containing-hemolysin-like protein